MSVPIKYPIEELVGKKFGHLTILAENAPKIYVTKKGKLQKSRQMICQCDCENKTVITRDLRNLLSSSNPSCGCSINREYKPVTKRDYSVRNPIHKDLTGQRFGKLVVVGYNETVMNRQHLQRGTWLCQCDCGNTCIADTHVLTGGGKQSCGCLKHKAKKYYHGLHDSRLYKIYRGMKQRCYNTNAPRYDRYGGRGIYICDEWYMPGAKGNPGFMNFYNWSMENGYHDPEPDQPKREWLTIDRIDNDGPYAPWNCRWIPKSEQTDNRSISVRVTINGTEYSPRELAKRFNVKSNTISNRRKLGWPDNLIGYMLLHPELEITRNHHGQYIDKEGNVINPDEIDVSL